MSKRLHKLGSLSGSAAPYTERKDTEMDSTTTTNPVRLTTAEQEYVLGGCVVDTFFTLDACKCPAFNRNINAWRREAERHPEDVKIVFEDGDHIIFKIRRKAMMFPKPRSTREFTEEQRAAAAERLHNTRKQK